MVDMFMVHMFLQVLWQQKHLLKLSHSHPEVRPKMSMALTPAPSSETLCFLIVNMHSLYLAEPERAGRHCGALRVILIDLFHKAIRCNPDTQWITKAVYEHKEMRDLTSAGKKSRGLGRGQKFHLTIGGSRHAAWKRRNTLQLYRQR
uniref:Ribosomal protein L15 n=1 Tax=Monopterus albus TaxID=43700 RepID=A0A3Q3IG75_MONAL